MSTIQFPEGVIPVLGYGLLPDEKHGGYLPLIETRLCPPPEETYIMITSIITSQIKSLIRTGQLTKQEIDQFEAQLLEKVRETLPNSEVFEV